MLKQVIENSVPFKTYFVESNETGLRCACTLTRGIWNIVETGAFFAYENQAAAVQEASRCDNCGEWCMYPAKYNESQNCEKCVPY